MPSAIRSRVATAACVVLLVTMPVAAGAGRALPFGDALARLDAHPALAAGDARVRAAEAARAGAGALRLPTLSLDANYSRISDPIELDLRRLNAALQMLDPNLPAIPNPVLQPDTFGFAMATVTWPVFTGGRIRAARHAAQAGIDAAAAGLDVVRDGLLLDLVARYHGLRIAREAADVQAGVVGSLQRHLRNAEALEREGQIARADRMRAEVALAQAEASLQQRRHAADLAEAALASLLESDDDALDPVTPLAELPPLPELARLQDEAARTHPLLRQLDALIAQAAQGVRAARAEYAPTIVFAGAYELESHQLPELIPEWTAGITMRLPLFDGGARRAKVSAAGALHDEAVAARREADDRIRLLVRERRLAGDDALRRVDVARRTVALAGESLRMQRLAFAEGEARSIDVVDAENALALVRLGLLAARYDHALGWAGAMLAAGRRGAVERAFSNGPDRGNDDD